MKLNRDLILPIVASVFLIFSSLLKPIITAIGGIVLLAVGIFFAVSKKKTD